MGIVPTAIGYSTWSAAMKHLHPSAAGSFLYLVPAVVVVMAWAVLGELPSPLTTLGGAKLGRRRCAPGCTREADGWEVDPRASECRTAVRAASG